MTRPYGVELQPKTCKACLQIFGPTRRPGPKRWAQVVACSKTCAAALRRTLEPRTCPACHVSFQPTARRAKYCGSACAAAAHKWPTPTKGKGERYKRVTDGDGTRLLEHRAIMEKVLGRKLLRSESVHHINGDSFDNRPENLELWYRAQPAGQRVSDLIEYIVQHHVDALAERLQPGMAFVELARRARGAA